MPILLPEKQTACKLWIDGVGCYLIHFGNELTIGNALVNSGSSLKLAIMADLHSQHATIHYRNETYRLRQHGQCVVNGQPVREEQILQNGNQIRLGSDVDVRLNLPSPLSQSASLCLESSHRFADGLDGAILFQQNCLLGPGTQKHIPCRDWASDIVIFTRKDILFCKAMQGEITVDGEQAGREVQLRDNAHLQGEDWSFRVEAVT